MSDWRRFIAALSAVLLLAATSLAGDWPSFRGPHGDGIAEGTGFPTSWGPEENIRWKVNLPHPGNGSPIVSQGRIFLTSATDDGRQRSLLCFDRTNGKQLWTRTVEYGEDETHRQNPFGSSTPAADGTRVVVWHSSAGLYCYDYSGKEVWSRNLGEFRHIWGYGSSPVINEGQVILQCGPGKRVFLTAIDLETGKTLWETDEPYQGTKPADDVGSWSTPVIARVGGKQQIICAMPTRVNGYDPKSGKVLWWCEGLSGPRYDAASSSPLISDGVCFAMADLRGPAMAFKLGGAGDITSTGRLWHVERRNPNSVGTGVFVDGHIFRPNSKPGTIECLEASTGSSLWKQRAGDYWASMVLAGGNLYALDQKGKTVVFKPNPAEFVEVASNELREATNATPAFSDGQIFIRTDESLYCIGQ